MVTRSHITCGLFRNKSAAICHSPSVCIYPTPSYVTSPLDPRPHVLLSCCREGRFAFCSPCTRQMPRQSAQVSSRFVFFQPVISKLHLCSNEHLEAQAKTMSHFSQATSTPSTLERKTSQKPERDWGRGRVSIFSQNP